MIEDDSDFNRDALILALQQHPRDLEGPEGGDEGSELDYPSVTRAEGAVRSGTIGSGDSATPGGRSSWRRFFRTVYSIVVLSEDEPLLTEDLELIANNIDEGPCVGSVEVASSVEVSFEAMKRLLLEVGNDGTFFDGSEDDDDAGT